jgi:HAMP domain-containing protein
MKKKVISRSAFFNPRVFISFLLLFGAGLLVFAALGISPATTARAQGAQQQQNSAPSRPPLLSPDEAQRVAHGLKTLVSQSTDGLVQVRRPDGAVSMDLQGRFQNVLLAKKESDGTVTQGCVDNPNSAAAFFELDPQTVGGSPRTVNGPQVPATLPDR